MLQRDLCDVLQGGRSQKTLDRYFGAVKSRDNARLEDLIVTHNIDVNISDNSGESNPHSLTQAVAQWLFLRSE